MKLPKVYVDATRLQVIAEAGLEQHFLDFLSRKSQAVLREVHLSDLKPQQRRLLPAILQSLSGGGLQSLSVWFEDGVPGVRG
jgi:hypothetical protein